MKLKNIPKKLMPLVFFSAFICYSQQPQSLRNFTYANIENKIEKPRLFLNMQKNGKTNHERIEEAVSSSLPFSNEIKELFNFYYIMSDNYQELKKLKDSFTSYGLIDNKNLNARLYLVNLRSLRNLNDYGLMLNLKLKPF